jgi:hypothetical protein
MSKDEDRDGRQQHLHADSDRSDHHTLPLVGEARRGRRVDIGNRYEDEEHYPDLVHLAAINLRGVGVPEFVDGLDERIDEPEQKQVLWRKGAVDQVFRQRRPVDSRQHETCRHDGQPEQRPEPAKQRTHEEHGAVQETVGIN